MIADKIDTIKDRLFTKAVMRRFKSLCDERGIEHSQVADAIGISYKITEQFHKGIYQSSISADTAAALADYFGVTMDSFRN